jgi:pyridoxine 4-dehydrogenase
MGVTQHATNLATRRGSALDDLPMQQHVRDIAEKCGRSKVWRIAFVPFAPLGSGDAGPRSVLNAPAVVAAAARLGCTPAQAVLAWTLVASPNILLIPGTSSLRHLEENLAVADVRLDDEAVLQLSDAVNGVRGG